MSSPGQWEGPPEEEPLSADELAFVDQFMIHRKATAALVALGKKGSKNTLHQQAYAIKARPNVKAEIARRMEEQSVKHQLTADRVLGEIMRIAFADVKDAYDPSGNLLEPNEMPEEFRRVISAIEQETDKNGEPKVRLRMWSKIEALGLLGKHLKLFHELIEAKVEGLSDDERKARITTILGRARQRKSGGTE